MKLIIEENEQKMSESAMYILLGAMMQGRTLEQAVTLAVDFTLECIRCTCADPAASWYGVEFEKALPWLARQNNAGAE